MGEEISCCCGEVRHVDGWNRESVELFQEHGKTECDKGGRKKTELHDDHETINKEERREGYR